MIGCIILAGLTFTGLPTFLRRSAQLFGVVGRDSWKCLLRGCKVPGHALYSLNRDLDRNWLNPVPNKWAVVREYNRQRSAHADDVDARSRKLPAKVMVVGQGNYSQRCDRGYEKRHPYRRGYPTACDHFAIQSRTA